MQQTPPLLLRRLLHQSVPWLAQVTYLLLLQNLVVACVLSILSASACMYTSYHCMVLPQATTETASRKASRKPMSKQHQAGPTMPQHLSRYAVKQLLAQGVSQQALDQIQAGKATAAAHQQSASDKEPIDAGHLRQPKCSAKSSKQQQLLSSGAAGLRARQDRIFSRISTLERQAADSSPASLDWREPNTALQVCCW